jgi:hypothetical protein
MTDDATPNPSPSDTPGDAGEEMISERELDEILSQASSLAADLSEEVGEAPPASASSSVSDVEADLDAELTELERLVAQTADAVESTIGQSGPAGSASGEPTLDGAEETPKHKSLVIPDFMDEFTRPEEPADQDDTPGPVDAAPAAFVEQSTTPPAEPMPGVIQGGTPAPTESYLPPREERITKPEPPEPEVPAAPKEVPAGPDRKLPERLSRLVQPVQAKAAPSLRTVCSAGVSLLETIDRPISRMGAASRQLLGLVAIATAGAALIVLLISLFR